MDLEHTSAAQAPPTILTCGDNYTYIWHLGDGRSFVVDPTDARMVVQALDSDRLTLVAALVTHHHADHTAGLAELQSRTGCRIIGPDAQRIAGLDVIVQDGQTVELGGRTVKVVGTPGHTRTSVCYYLPPAPGERPGHVFTGDTLFVGGCGRPIECDARVLWTSLQRLAALPDETLLWCGHDYTVENYEFALTIESGNQAIRQRLNETRQAAAHGRPSVPSTIAREKATNIFLRAGDPAVRGALGMDPADAERVFAELRRRKTLWG